MHKQTCSVLVLLTFHRRRQFHGEVALMSKKMEMEEEISDYYSWCMPKVVVIMVRYTECNCFSWKKNYRMYHLC